MNMYSRISLSLVVGVVLAMTNSVGQAQMLSITNGLTFWVKAYEGVTATGVFVSNWADQSGNGYDASQGTVLQQPQLIPNVQNGKPMIRFDGADVYPDYLQSSATLADVISASSFTAFAVFKVTGNTDTHNDIWNQDAVFGDSSGYMSLAVRDINPDFSSTLRTILYNYDGNADEARININYGELEMFDVRHDSGSIYALTVTCLTNDIPFRIRGHRQEHCDSAPRNRNENSASHRNEPTVAMLKPRSAFKPARYCQAGDCH